MTDELIERLARACGLTDPDLAPWMTDYGNAEDSIRRFAALIAEECAKVCDEQVAVYDTLIERDRCDEELTDLRECYKEAVERMAHAIRERYGGPAPSSYWVVNPENTANYFYDHWVVNPENTANYFYDWVCD